MFSTTCAALNNLHSHSKSQLPYLQMWYNLPYLSSFILISVSGTAVSLAAQAQNPGITFNFIFLLSTSRSPVSLSSKTMIPELCRGTRHSSGNRGIF